MLRCKVPIAPIGYVALPYSLWEEKKSCFYSAEALLCLFLHPWPDRDDFFSFDYLNMICNLPTILFGNLLVAHLAKILYMRFEILR